MVASDSRLDLASCTSVGNTADRGGAFAADGVEATGATTLATNFSWIASNTAVVGGG